MGRQHLSKDIINQRLKHRGIMLIGDYINTQTKTAFQCSKGHIWYAKPNNLTSVRQSGCPHCDGQYPLTAAAVNSRIEHKKVRLLSDYTGVDQKTNFQCLSCDATFVSTPYLMMTKSFCPECHQRSGGFKKHKPGFLYVIEIPELNCFKYGITNNLKQRLSKHAKSADFVLRFSKDYDSGYDAFLLEQRIKQTFKKPSASKHQLPDGYTETLSLELLQDVLNLIHTPQ